MITKKILFAFAFFIHSAINVEAQQQSSEFELIKSLFETEKRGFFEEYMELSPEEETTFWPIYEDYEIDRSVFSRKRLDALRFFVANYESMTDAQAKDFMSDIFSIQKNDLKLRKKYYNLFSSKVSEKKAVRFIQIEEYINTKIRLEILEVLPFIRE